MTIPSAFATTAITMSLLAELLVIDRVPGLGWLLLTFASWLAVRFLLRQSERRSPGWVQLLWLVPFVVSISSTCYDAELVRSVAPPLNALALLACVYWSFLGSDGQDCFAHALRLPKVGLPFQVLEEARIGLAGLRASSDPDRQLLWRKIAQGLLVSLPFLAIFTLLFSSDAVFYDRLTHGCDLLSGNLLLPVLRTGALALLLLGFFRALLLRRTSIQPPADDANQLDSIILSTVMIMLNLLFASFLVIQGRYLFGGQLQIALPGVTYAQYARAGFWELVSATALVLAISALVYRSSSRTHAGRWPLALNSLLILQTYGVAASAARRLLMLIDAYGLTLVRLYGAVGILFMMALLALVLMAVVLGWSWPRLEARAAMLGLLLASSVLLVNAEGVVATLNLRRPQVDLTYLSGLSTDAWPALRGHAMLNPRPGVEGWQSWNWSRARAALSSTELQGAEPRG